MVIGERKRIIAQHRRTFVNPAVMSSTESHANHGCTRRDILFTILLYLKVKNATYNQDLITPFFPFSPYLRFLGKHYLLHSRIYARAHVHRHKKLTVPSCKRSDFLIIALKVRRARHNCYLRTYKTYIRFVACNDKQRKQSRSRFYVRR